MTGCVATLADGDWQPEAGAMVSGIRIQLRCHITHEVLEDLVGYVSCEAKGLAYKFARFWALPLLAGQGHLSRHSHGRSGAPRNRALSVAPRQPDRVGQHRPVR